MVFAYPHDIPMLDLTCAAAYAAAAVAARTAVVLVAGWRLLVSCSPFEGRNTPGVASCIQPMVLSAITHAPLSVFQHCYKAVHAGSIEACNGARLAIDIA